MIYSLKTDNIQLKLFCCYLQHVFAAASGGHAELTKLLLDKGADIKILTEAGLKGTALHHAAGKGHYECVRYYYSN